MADLLRRLLLLLLHTMLRLARLYDWVRPWSTRRCTATRYLLYACSRRSRGGLRL